MTTAITHTYQQTTGCIDMIIIPVSAVLTNNGYIAGSGDGLVTVRGKAAARKIWLLNARTLQIEQVASSLQNGHYLFMGLDLNKRYLVMVRDYKKEFEPFVWDHVQPADDLTIDEQQALWASWQA